MGKWIAQAPIVNTVSGAPDQHFQVQIIKLIFKILAETFRIGSL